MTCPVADKTGVLLPVFTDRLCDNFPDCPDGADEDGTMFPCDIKKTTAQCCDTFMFFSAYTFTCTFTRSQIDLSFADYNGILICPIRHIFPSIFHILYGVGTSCNTHFYTACTQGNNFIYHF